MADKTNMRLSPEIGLGFSSPGGVTQARAAVVLGLRLPGSGAFPGGSDDKESACNVGDLGSIPGLGRSAGEGMTTYSSGIAWRLPWTEEPGGLRSMGLQTVGHS